MDLRRAGESYLPLHGAPIHNAFDSIDGFDARLALDIRVGSLAGHGGGICMSFVDILPFTLVEVFFQDVVLRDNEAVVGGGASLHFTDLLWSRGDMKYCISRMIGIEFCQRMYFNNVTIRDNQADYAGGLFISHPDSVIVTCNMTDVQLNSTFEAVYNRKIQAQEVLDPMLDLQCLVIEDNRISVCHLPCQDVCFDEDGAMQDGETVDGADVGTLARALAIDGLEEGTDLRRVASGEKLSLPCDEKGEKASSCLEGFTVSVLDAFNQTISRGIDDASLELSLESPNIGGAIHYVTKHGVARIDATMARGIGVESYVTILNDREPSIRTQAVFSTRRCYPGEFVTGDSCHSCPADVYSFNASLGQCHPCEAHARCRGQASLVPEVGYWHSTPFSPKFHRCIEKEACRFDDREKNLDAFYQNEEELQKDLDKMNAYLEGNDSLPEFPNYQQCAEGYEGVLCGSCQQDHGHGFSGTCVSCPSERGNAGMLLAAAIFWTFVVIGVNCLVTLMSARTRIQLVRHETHNQDNNRAGTLERTTAHIRESVSVRILPSGPCTLSPANSGFSDVFCHQVLTQYLVTTVQLTETLKILINYLQVTSSAMRLSVDWSRVLNSLLSVEGAPP